MAAAVEVVDEEEGEEDDGQSADHNGYPPRAVRPASSANPAACGAVRQDNLIRAASAGAAPGALLPLGAFPPSPVKPAELKREWTPGGDLVISRVMSSPPAAPVADVQQQQAGGAAPTSPVVARVAPPPVLQRQHASIGGAAAGEAQQKRSSTPTWFAAPAEEERNTTPTTLVPPQQQQATLVAAGGNAPKPHAPRLRVSPPVRRHASPPTDGVLSSSASSSPHNDGPLPLPLPLPLPPPIRTSVSSATSSAAGSSGSKRMPSAAEGAPTPWPVVVRRPADTGGDKC